MNGLSQDQIDSLRERFDKYYSPEPNSGCWLWTLKGGQYGQLRVRGVERRCIGAHRVSWLLHYGGIPPGMFVCHKCDVRGCVNPEHLFLGTIQDNVADMDAKGRRVVIFGEARPIAKLNADKVHAIRAASGSYKSIGKQFGVSPQTVCNVKLGRLWTHIQ
ncbi:HNH nuclease [uncultured Caudovirales phage]|uniref:HNH nuclease n=1 Tax=uncultured Caudovirales phage TaxID=2100421 RepID=A0A6J5SC64_9CAUD|nr:HNH nuclease [uncultured Caudovirales phage]CAB4211078.1 HNH nuclease [uncultured Caudovirales phage]CAB4223445.1 HNH nuclease [uncultured Caudovirales phage]